MKKAICTSEKTALEARVSHFIEDSRFTLSTNSEAGRKSYADWLGYSVDEIKMVHNGVDFRRMEKSLELQCLKRSFPSIKWKSHKVVGGVFRLEPGKRAELWLDSIDHALAHDSGIRGLIVGGGRMERTIERWINEKRLHRSSFGWRGGRRSVLARKNGCVFTYFIYRGLPNVAIEAQGLEFQLSLRMFGVLVRLWNRGNRR